MLEKAGIRPSPARILTIRVLLDASRPLSALEIERQLDTVDRSSISRTLSTLAEEHLIHQISDGSGSMRYELCADSSSDIHNDQHAHFHCRQCGQTICLKQISIPNINIPDGYLIETASLVITGLCDNCNRR